MTPKKGDTISIDFNGTYKEKFVINTVEERVRPAITHTDGSISPAHTSLHVCDKKGRFFELYNGFWEVIPKR